MLRFGPCRMSRSQIARDRRIDRRHPRARTASSRRFPSASASRSSSRSILPAPFMPVFARQLGDRGEARGAGRRRGHVAASRPDHHRAGRCASPGRRRVGRADRPPRPQRIFMRLPALGRPDVVSRSARSTAPARSASFSRAWDVTVLRAPRGWSLRRLRPGPG